MTPRFKVCIRISSYPKRNQEALPRRSSGCGRVFFTFIQKFLLFPGGDQVMSFAEKSVSPR